MWSGVELYQTGGRPGDVFVIVCYGITRTVTLKYIE
jgi:hypothetical protein